MKTQLIQFLNNPTDGNALVAFMQAWIQHKVPSRGISDVHMFIDLFMHGLMNVPPMIDPRYQEALQSMLAQAKADLHVTEVQIPDKQVIKYI